jgi:hypothetical protein
VQRREETMTEGEYGRWMRRIREAGGLPELEAIELAIVDMEVEPRQRRTILTTLMQKRQLVFRAAESLEVDD